MDRLFRINFYPQDWLIDTARLTPEERGIYIQIVCLLYSNRGPIVNDAQWIAGVSGCSSRAVKSHINSLIIKGFLSLTNDKKLTQKRVMDEIKTKQNHFDNSSKGGSSKASKKDFRDSFEGNSSKKTARKVVEHSANTPRKSHETIDELNENNNLTSSEGENSLPSPIALAIAIDSNSIELQSPLAPLGDEPIIEAQVETKSEKKTDGKKQPHRLPENWFTEKHESFAQAEGMDRAEIERTVQNFQDYWLSKPKNATKTDWLATWRIWVRTEIDRKNQKNQRFHSAPNGKRDYFGGLMQSAQRAHSQTKRSMEGEN